MSEDTNEQPPPARISIRFCPVCGRDDRFGTLGLTSHFSYGKKCPGKVRNVYYTPEESR